MASSLQYTITDADGRVDGVISKPLSEWYISSVEMLHESFSASLHFF